MESTVDVIVVSFNRPHETGQTIKSLLKANDDINVILIDNASTEKPKFKPNERLTVIYLGKNIGQAGAVNLWLRTSRAEYICFMHNDITVKDKNWIRKAVEFLKENPEAGLVDVYGYKNQDGQLTRITSMKGHDYQDIVKPEQDFTEVDRTDEMANIFKNDGYVADERYDLTCCGIWIEVLARGQKLYVIKLDDAEHFKSNSAYPSKEVADQQYWLRRNIRLRKLKEVGLQDIIYK